MSAETIGLIQPKIGASRRRLTAAYFATFVALGLTTGSLGPTLPALATQTQSSLSSISYLFTFRSLGYVVGSVQGGKLFDHQPGNIVMSMMLLLAAVTLLLVPFSMQLATVLGPIIVARFAFSGQQVSTQSYLLLAVVLLPIAGLGTVAAAAYLTSLFCSMASVFPATLSFASRRLRVTGKTTGWFVVGSSLGATSIPLAIRKTLTLVGPRSVILLPALALLLAGVVLAILTAPAARPKLGCVRGT